MATIVDLFGRDVIGSPHRLTGRGHLHAFTIPQLQSCQALIKQLDISSFANHHVGWFDVAVDKTLFINVLKGDRRLLQAVSRNVARNRVRDSE